MTYYDEDGMLRRLDSGDMDLIPHSRRKNRSNRLWLRLLYQFGKIDYFKFSRLMKCQVDADREDEHHRCALQAKVGRMP